MPVGAESPREEAVTARSCGWRPSSVTAVLSVVAPVQARVAATRSFGDDRRASLDPAVDHRKRGRVWRLGGLRGLPGWSVSY